MRARTGPVRKKDSSSSSKKKRLVVVKKKDSLHSFFFLYLHRMRSAIFTYDAFDGTMYDAE